MTDCYLLYIIVKYIDGTEQHRIYPIAVFESEEDAENAIDKDENADKILEEFDEATCEYFVVKLPFKEKL